MKSLIILFAAENVDYGFEKSFDSKSAFYLSLKYSYDLCEFLSAQNSEENSELAIFCSEKNINLIKSEVENFTSEFNFKNSISFVKNEFWSNEILFEEISKSATETQSKNVIFSNAFCPFLNLELTKKLIKTHSTFQSEYCFADGFPRGVSPEILDCGLCKILSELIKTKVDLKSKGATDSSIFDLIKTDINSFEIETEISEIDWRMYRFNFSCTKKENFVASKNLFNKIQSLKSSSEFLQSDENDIQKILEVASKTENVLKPIPAFFNIQLCAKYLSDSPFCAFTKFKKENPQNEIFTNDLSLESLKEILKQINEINPESVISFSLWGNPLLHKNFFEACKEVLKYDEFSLFIETEGFDFSTQDLNPESDFYKNLIELSNFVNQIEKNNKPRKNGFAPIMFVVNIDAMTQETFSKIHPNQNLLDAQKSLKILSELFPQNVYAQFLRLSCNEDELELFFRTFKEKSSLSQGNFIIQKYDDFCKILPDYKPADLSPVDRFPCWHLRRDFCILSNGDVPICKSKSFVKIEKNIFKIQNQQNSILEIFENYNENLKNHIEKNYCKGCKDCDEYYTYNF